MQFESILTALLIALALAIVLAVYDHGLGQIEAQRARRRGAAL